MLPTTPEPLADAERAFFVAKRNRDTSAAAAASLSISASSNSAGATPAAVAVRGADAMTAKQRRS